MAKRATKASVNKECTPVQIPPSVYVHVVSSWPNIKNRPIAAFDFDSTLKEHRGKGPWDMMTARALTHLATHYNIAIFSNRRTGKSADKKSTAALDEYALRIGAPFSKSREVAIGAARADGDKKSGFMLPPVEGSVIFMGSLKHDRYRKPHRGMWELYLQLLEASGYALTPRMRALSFYCGDAAGRPGDFAASDYAFARHCGVQFLVPEMLFGGLDDPSTAFPWKLPADCNVDADYTPDDLKMLTESAGGGSAKIALAAVKKAMESGAARFGKRCLVVLMGGQGSGKSTTTRLLAANGFLVISRETSKEAACLRDARRALKADEALVAVDGTHPTTESRASYLALGREEKALTVIVHITTPKRLCMHMNAARCELDRSNKTEEIPVIAIHKTWKQLQPPEKEEADAVLSIPFSLDPGAPPEVTSFRYP